MKKQEKKTNKVIINTIKTHIQHNRKQYLIVAIIFLIGVVLGVTVINRIDVDSKEGITNYITSFTNNLKTDYEIDKMSLIKSCIMNYIVMAFIMWFMGSTVIGIPLVYMIVGLKGFSLGCTISSIIAAFGTLNGILFSIITLFFQNIIIIPCILALAVSGIKLYSSIMQDRRRENIKVEIMRHTIFSLLMVGMLLVASFIEVYISSNLLTVCIDFL